MSRSLGRTSYPRESAEILDGLVKTKSGLSVDKEFRKGAKKALDIIMKNDVDLVILQSRSPSCGVNNIYDGTFTGKIIEGQGVFAKLLQKNEVPVVDVEDL